MSWLKTIQTVGVLLAVLVWALNVAVAVAENQDRKSEEVDGSAVILNREEKTQVRDERGVEMLDKCATGHLKDVRRLLALDKTLSMYTNKDGETPLHVACIDGEVDVIRLLLKMDNINANARATGERSLSMTPLSWCVFGGHIESVDVLVTEGKADVNAVFLDQSNNHLTVLDVCDIIGQHRKAIAARLLSAGGLRFKELTVMANGVCQKNSPQGQNGEPEKTTGRREELR